MSEASRSSTASSRMPLLLGLAAAALVALALVWIVRREGAAKDAAVTAAATPAAPASATSPGAAQTPGDDAEPADRAAPSASPRSDVERARKLRQQLGIEPTPPKKDTN